MYTYRATITAVYDGDTVTADIDLGFGVWLRGQKLRLARIDAPEVRGPTRPAGLKSRDNLRALVLGRRVEVRTFKDRRGKYGRWIAEILIDDGKEADNINDLLLVSGFAKPYRGKRG